MAKTKEKEIVSDAAAAVEVPSFTLRADSRFGVESIVALNRFWLDEGSPSPELIAAERAFELYEETHRKR